jgi:3-isopropylmalate/(R)-2-methylmalate dehydratase large subunit
MNSQQTLAEQLISRRADKNVAAGEIVLVEVDGTISHDAGAPYSIQTFEAMQGKRLWDPKRVTLVIDHASPAPSSHVSQLHQMIRDFASRTGCRLFDVGDGICHQLMVENELVNAGDILLGGDSHTCTYGALGAFAAGMGSTDIAAIWLTGKTWLRVPRSQRIILEGTLRPGVFAKDIMLYLVGKIGMAGAVYEALEFFGSGLERLSQSDKLTLANMAAETGAKTALMWTEAFKKHSFVVPPESVYPVIHRIDLSELSPQVCLPHSPDKAVPVDRVAGEKIQMAYIGTCANGRIEDLRAAAAVLNGQSVARGVQLLISPASRTVLAKTVRDGTLAVLLASGATILPPGCGPCAGTHLGVPADGQTVISTANRNFPGRMGNPHGKIYLASPAMAAASAVRGEITDPSPFFQQVKTSQTSF